MDVQNVAAAGSSQSDGTPQVQGVAAPPAASSSASSGNPNARSADAATLASVVAKLYNVTQGSSGEPAQLSISYKYVSQLQLVVTVFTNPQTGEEVAQFPAQELIGLAELFDQVDGVTLDRKV